MRHKAAPPLRGQAPCRLLRAASGPPPALRAPTRHPPGVALHCTPRASRSPAYRGPQGGRTVPPVAAPPPKPKLATSGHHHRKVFKKTSHRLCSQQPTQVSHPLPSPPPLPAGKGSESPSVVRGAGCAALRLLLLPPAGERWDVPRASRVRFALRGGPCPRLRLRAAPATPTALDPLST